MRKLTWVDLEQALVFALAVLGLNTILYSVWPSLYLVVAAAISTALVGLFLLRRSEDLAPAALVLLAVAVIIGIATLVFNAPNSWILMVLVVALSHLALRALGLNAPHPAPAAA